MTTTLPASLAEYSDAELCEFYNASAGEGWHALLEAEMARRDREAARPDPRQEQRAEWERMAHAQWLDAERVCRGELLNARGMREHVDPWSLWSGPAHRVDLYASEELRNYWLANPRVDITTYQRQAAGEHRAWIDRHDREAPNDGLDSDARSAVRRIASQRQQGAAVRGDGRGNDVPGRAARAGAQGIPASGAAAGTGGPVRGGRVSETTGMTSRERLHARAAEIRARAPGDTVAGDEQPAQASAVPAAYGGSQGVVAVWPGGTVTSAAADRATLIIAESLRYAERILTRHVAWPSPAALDTVLLWVLHANARDRDDAGYGPLIWRASPRLLLTSRQRGSGKSTGLDLIGMLTGNSGRPSKITPRSIAHKLANKHETVTLDEAKLMFGSGNASRELQGLLLTGYTRRGTYSYSSGGKDVDLKTFGPVAYAGKDELITDTSGLLGDLLDRSIVIRMRRASRHYPDIDDAADDGAELACRGMATWATTMQGELSAAATRLSREAADAGTLAASDVEAGQLRITQIWRPLLACADVLGGDWPARARAAAAAGDAETGEWLADLRELEGALFDDDAEDDES